VHIRAESHAGAENVQLRGFRQLRCNRERPEQTDRRREAAETLAHGHGRVLQHRDALYTRHLFAEAEKAAQQAAAMSEPFKIRSRYRRQAFSPTALAGRIYITM